MQVFLGILKWIGIVVGVLIALLFVVLVVLPPLTRAATDRWGATDAEVARTFPGDGLVAEPDQNSTRAITIDAPPELVFALVRQMGYQRGGWYAWDWFYQATGSADFVDGHHSRRIDPDLQAIGTGDGIEIFPGARLDVVRYAEPSALVLYKMTDGENKLVKPGDPVPDAFSDLLWSWNVEPGEDGGSRLILRTRASDAGMPGFVEWINDGPLEMGGAVFGYKTLYGIKRTAEKLHEAGVVVDKAGVQIAGPASGLDEVN